MSDLVDIFGPSASDSATLAGIFGSSAPDFSDVTDGATSTADNLRRKKRAELAAALAAQQGAPNAGLGSEPREDGIVFNNMAADFGRNVLSGAKQGADFVAHLPPMALNSMGSLEESAAGLGAPGNRSPLREAVRNPEPDAAVVPPAPRVPISPLTLTDFGLPPVIEDTFQSARDERSRLADAAAARGAANGLPPALSALTFAVPQTVGNALDPTMLLGAGEAGRASKALEDAPLLTKLFGPPAADASKVLLDEAPGDAAFLAKRAKVMAGMPGGEEPFAGPGAVADAVAPRGGILQVGRQADDRAQEVALGLRAPDPTDPALLELQRASLPIGETPPPTGYRFQRDPGAPAGHPDRGGVWFSAKPDPATYRRTGGNSMYEGGRNLVSAPMDFENPALLEEPHPGPRNGPSHWVLAQHDPEFLKMVASAPPEGQQAILEQMGVPTFEAQNIVQRKAAYTFASDRRAADILRGQGHDGAILSREGAPTEFIDLRPSQVSAPPSLAEIFGDTLSPRPGDSAGGHILPPAEGVVFGNGLILPAESPRAPFSPPIEAPGGTAIPAGNIPDLFRDPPAASSFPTSLEGAKPEGLPTADAAPTLRNLLTREEVPLDTPTTGTKNAVTTAERFARDLPEVEALARKSTGDTWGEARQIFDADPEAPRLLAQRIVQAPRALTPIENDLLLHDRMKLTLDHREALGAEDAALQAGDTEGAALAKIRRTSIESAMDANDTAVKRSGTEWSAAGSARQKLIAEDYSPLYLRQRLTVAARESGAAEIPGATDRLTEISRQLEEAHQQLATYEQRLSETQAAGKVRAAQGDVAAAERSGVRRAAREDLDAEYQTLNAQLEAKARKNQSTVNMSGGLDPETVGIIGKMARNRVQAGARGLGEVVDGIYQTIRPHIEGLEPSEVRDAISGYGTVRPQVARSEAVKELARIRQEARVLAALEDARAAGRPAGDVAQLERQAQLIADRHLPVGRGPLSDAEHLAATKNRLARREAELTQHIADDYFPKRTRRPVALDSDAIALQGRVNALKQKADLIIRKQELAGRSGAEKAMDLTAGWGRFIKLTGTATLQKISAAAAERALVFRPIEEVLGAGWSKAPLVKHFAGAAPIEGGGSLDAVAKSYAGFFGKAARDEMAAHFHGVEGPMGSALGKVHLGGEVPEWMSYPGHVHAGLKAPAKIAGYEYAMEKQAKHYLQLGQAEKLTDLGVIAEMKAAAWEYAERDIFMGDNAAVRAINKALGDEVGQSTAAKAGKTVGRVLMPIVKVPTNYALEATDYLGGLPKGALGINKTLRAGRAALAKTPGADQNLAAVVKAGLEQLPPGQAERIMRQLKKGSLGAGLIALGATGVVKVGGYYDGPRPDSDLQPGQIEIAGHVIPHLILHHPALEALQVGGTIFRAHSLSSGLGTAARGLAEQVPFIETPVSMARDLWGREPTKAVGSLERGMTIPPDAQRLARVLDQKGPPKTPAELALQELGWIDIHAKKRKPHGSTLRKIGLEEELGLPGLRGNVR